MALQLFSHSEQVAAYLRAELLRGRWNDALPGILSLSERLGVNHNTIHAALQILEAEGLLVSQGNGRPRRIVLPKEAKAISLRVRFLLYDKADREQGYYVAILHRLQEAGYLTKFAEKTQRDLGMDAGRIGRYAQQNEADAWVVSAGSREVLQWFSEQPFPTFAMFGRMSGLPIAGMAPRKAPALITGIRKLVELGHRRIVMLAREERRKPHPSIFEQAFLDELAAHGIMPGPYHLPDWEEGREGFHRGLDSLFRLTPPTALVISEPALFVAAQQHLALQGILAPRDVSMICDDPDPAFAWCDPAISHIRWDSLPIVQRVQRWADNIATGKDDRRQSYTKSEFVVGGTIGPARGMRPELA